MIGKIIRKSIKKFITWFFGKRSCFTKSSKQGGCYLVLLKVQYRSSHFWIIWKTLSLDYRPEGERIILKSKNLQIIDMNQTKTGVDTLTKFGKLL